MQSRTSGKAPDMLQDLLAVPLHGGGRRHRFMESSDFNVAARYVFRTLRGLVDGGKYLSPGFVGFEIDASTPGVVIASCGLRLQRPDVVAAMSLRKDMASSIDAAFSHLLDISSDHALIGFVCRGKDLGQGERTIRLELRSVDQRATAVYRYDEQLRRLGFAALAFKGHATRPGPA